VGASEPDPNLRVACDAMCGGLARWLRALGVDATYTPGIDDGELVEQARKENRVVISTDGPLLQRGVFTSGRLRALRLPVGLRLSEQVETAVRELRIRVAFPRCTLCNGSLAAVGRDQVADVVPARSLIWAREFYRCTNCGHVFWEGSHWRRIGRVRERFKAMQDRASAPPTRSEPQP
jgi:uncharacterized protein with PIN domain